jgi:hypothetical protein
LVSNWIYVTDSWNIWLQNSSKLLMFCVKWKFSIIWFLHFFYMTTPCPFVLKTPHNAPSKGVRVMVFNATFNNISVISWRSVLLVNKTIVPGENHQSVASQWQTLSHNVVSCTPRHEKDSMLYRIHLFPWEGFELTTLVVIGTDCTGNCKSNYHTITTMTAPFSLNSLNDEMEI